MIPCLSASCTKPPREAMLCVTVGAAEIRRVICIECRVALDRQGRAVNVHHGGSVATWRDSRLIPVVAVEPVAVDPVAIPSQSPSPESTMPQPRCLFPGCESAVVKSRGLCGRDLSRARTLGMLEVEDIDYPALGPAWVNREAARGEVNTEIARLTAALEASNARNLDTIESVVRLERERDEARAELAKVAALLDAEGAGDRDEPGEPVSTTLRYWLEACKQTEIELRHSRDEVRAKLKQAYTDIAEQPIIGEHVADPCRPDLTVVAILLDGLEAEAGKADREGDVAMVRAIRAALGVRT